MELGGIGEGQGQQGQQGEEIGFEDLGHRYVGGNCIWYYGAI